MWYTMGMDAARVERLGKEVLADFKARASDWLEAGRSGAVEEKRWLVTPEETICAAEIGRVIVGGADGKRSLVCLCGGMSCIALYPIADAVAERAYARVSRWLTTGEDGDLVWTQRGFRLRRKRIPAEEDLGWGV